MEGFFNMVYDVFILKFFKILINEYFNVKLC